MRKRGIRGKIITGLLFFALVLVVLTSSIVAGRYYKLKIAEYNDIVYGYLHTASDLIDGDRIEGYLETEEPDEYYDTILAYLTATQKETDLRLFYVFVPYEDDLVYVWQTDEDPYSWLGYRENYMDGGKETRDATFRKDPVEEITFYKDPTYGNIACGFYPVFDSAGEPVALVGLDLSTPDLRMIIASFIITIVIIIILAALVAGNMFYRMLSRDLVRPVNKLNEATKRMLSDLESDSIPDIDIHTQDELEDLAESFNKMHRDLKRYISENASISAEKGRIDAELNLASRIQESALPNEFPLFPEKKEFDVFALMNPAKEVGGDFYDFFLVDDSHLAITVADVSGKGVPGAIFSMITMITIQNNAKLGMSVEETLSRANDQICQNNSEDMFVTVWFAILDLKNGVLNAANAGHEYPMIRRAGGQFEIYNDEPHGLAIGFMEGITYNSYNIQLNVGDEIFQYSDGVPESMREDESLFGLDRAVAALNVDPQAEPAALIDNMRKAIDEFVGEAEQFDDITMMCLRYNGERNGTVSDSK